MAALNEEQGIGPTIQEIKHFLKDPAFLVVDGNSLDKTCEIAKKFDAEIVEQPRRGKGDAIACGVRRADFDGKYVVMIDSDFTYPAEFIPRMLKILDERPLVGMVCGNRFNDKYAMEGMERRFFIGNKFLAFTHNFFNGVQLKDPLTGLRVVRWDILKKWKPKSSGFDIEVELNHFVEREGYEIVEVPIGLRHRLGRKKLSIFDGFTILKRIFLESTY
jgi:dolichol-phosphate mannosyltransferase